METTGSQFKARVRVAIIAELEQKHYKARKLTDGDLAAIVSEIAEADFHETNAVILSELGPHLVSAIKVLDAFARPDGFVAPQSCPECHSPGRVSYVGTAAGGNTGIARLIADHPAFSSPATLGSSHQVRALTQQLRSLQRLHSNGNWKRSHVRAMAGDPLLHLPWRRTTRDVTIRDRALLSLLAEKLAGAAVRTNSGSRDPSRDGMHPQGDAPRGHKASAKATAVTTPVAADAEYWLTHHDSEHAARTRARNTNRQRTPCAVSTAIAVA